MTQGQRLKEARKYIGLTQEKLGEKFELKQHSIKAMEIGQQKISIDFAEEMERLFSIRGWWLLTGEGEMIKSDAGESLSEDEKKIIYSYRKLPTERQEWYYYKIIAESLD